MTNYIRNMKYAKFKIELIQRRTIDPILKSYLYTLNNYYLTS